MLGVVRGDVELGRARREPPEGAAAGARLAAALLGALKKVLVVRGAEVPGKIDEFYFIFYHVFPDMKKYMRKERHVRSTYAACSFTNLAR